MNYLELCERTRKAEEKAIEAFWKEIKENCTEIKTNYLMSMDRRDFVEKAHSVILEWYKLNSDECNSYYKECCKAVLKID